MARTFDGNVEAFKAPIANTIKIRSENDPRYSGEGNVYTADTADDLFNTMMDAGKKYSVPIVVYAPDIEKGRKGGFSVAELSKLDMDVYSVKLLTGRFGAYVAVLKNDPTRASNSVAKTIVL